MITCRYCGVAVRKINYSLGESWRHSPYPGNTRDAYQYCRKLVATPMEQLVLDIL